MEALPTQEYSLPHFELQQIADALEKNLKDYFGHVSVGVVDCPPLDVAPYNLATKGIGGYGVIVDLGGVPYLLPLPDKSKVYPLEKVIPEGVGLRDKFPDGYYISGAAAGPFPSQGSNCEMIVSLQVDNDGVVTKNKSVVSTTSSGDEKDLSVKALKDESRVALLANLLVSSGPGKVLEIKCGGRKGEGTNLTTSIRESLNKAFGPTTPIALGGLFTLKESPTKIHVMRDFSKEPLTSDEDVEEWLKFFNVPPPFLAQSVLVSNDPGLDLRVEHSHGWTLDNNSAGHYHEDTLPDAVQYHAIYALASKIIRIDRPVVTHNIGRD